MILKLFSRYELVKTIYTRILKPVYLELRKDAYAEEGQKRKHRKKSNGRKRN